MSRTRPRLRRLERGRQDHLNPKWWLLAFGVLFLLAGIGNYLSAEGSADTAYPCDYTARDVFYEQTFGLFHGDGNVGHRDLMKVSGRNFPSSYDVFRGDDGLLGAHYMAGETSTTGSTILSCWVLCCLCWLCWASPDSYADGERIQRSRI